MFTLKKKSKIKKKSVGRYEKLNKHDLTPKLRAIVETISQKVRYIILHKTKALALFLVKRKTPESPL